MNVLTYYNIMHGGFLITFVQHAQPIHYNLEVQANPKKKWHKKTDAIFSIYGKNGINP